VSELADNLHICLDRRRKRVLYGLGQTVGGAVILARPRTYMNESGRAIAPLVRFYQVPRGNLLVVYDDLDLPLGTLRMRPHGGSGGHKGMRSIIQHLGGDSSFPRLRLGIGRPPDHLDPSSYVLQDFGHDEEPVVREVLERAVAAARLWLFEGLESAMNAYN
jgi:PTH1 family peptidyl-tRNA hydrolase